MSDVTGIQRLRQAIDNQSAAGEACFSLPIGEAYAICDEVDDGLAQLAWAKGVPAPVDADGEVVPLTTREMYTGTGRKIELTDFDLLHSVLSGGFVWRAIRNTGHGVEDLTLSILHLRRPDSWEKLEEDVERMVPDEDMPSECHYFTTGDYLKCRDCPAVDIDCTHYVVSDVLRRAKAIAERDTKASTSQSSPHEAKEGGRA